MPLPTSPTTNTLSPERLRAVIASPGGYGKTELAADWFPQSNLIIDLEGGTRFLSGAHYIERPKNLDAFAALINELVTTQHQFTTVTIDTGDKWVRLADSAAGMRHGKVSAASVEYGKGLGDRDGVVFRDLNKLLSTDLGVLFLTHSTKVTVKDANGTESIVRYPRIESGQEGDRLRQPIIGEFDYVFHVEKISEDNRVLITGGDPRFETKRRYALPDVIPLPKGQGAQALYAALVESAQQHQTA